MATDAARSVIAGMHEDGEAIPHEPSGAVVTSITIGSVPVGAAA